MCTGGSSKPLADSMGQCQFLKCNASDSSKAQFGTNTLEIPRHESANDSGHSSAESLVPNKDSREPLCSQSSESSGKFSLRGSISSHPDSDPLHKTVVKGSHNEDLPVFVENGESADSGNPTTRRPLKRRTHGSYSSFGSRGHFFFQSKNPSWSKTTYEATELPTTEAKPPRRTVSLRLPRSRHTKDIDSKVPTVYVEDEEMVKQPDRKSSLQKALSLLSLNSLTKENSSSPRDQKARQRILRPPIRRHTTVRGISGLAIEVRSPADHGPGLRRAQTLVYYPTPTSLRTYQRPSYVA